MRVLHIDAGREMRGGQWQVVYLLEGLTAAGCEVTLLAAERSPLLWEAQRRGLDVRTLELTALRKLAREADLVHAHDARTHTLAALCTRKPLVVARRVAFAVGRNPASWCKYRLAAHFIAVSEFVKKRLEAAGVAPEKISVVYDGVLPREPVARGERIVAPASEDPKKGSDLVRAAARLLAVDVHFSSHLMEDMAGACMLVYATREEGLGSAALVAMAAGVPVVVSRVGGLPEVVEDGQTGLLVENTAESIARGMATVMDDAELAASLAERAWRRAVERFSVARMVQDTMQVYRKVLSC
jgi:glycosyltransferase involved in cell wall biosynthesis